VTSLSSVRPAAQIAAARCSPPPIAADIVERSRLFDVLDRGIAGPLTLITGPPGAGKTTLLSSWLGQRRIPDGVSWLSVDRADATPAQFWSAVIEAVDHAGEPRLRSLMGRLGLDRDDFLSALAGMLATRSTPLVLILDDFHELAPPEVSEQLDALLRHPLPMLRLVIASRADPRLSLPRLRLQGRMTELRGADLALTVQEAGCMFDLAGLIVGADQVAALHARTEGWVAGLRLAALLLGTTGDVDELVETFAGDEHSVADYLVDEVLQRQPAQIRDFMLRTSVVDPLSAELANALTGRSDGAWTLDVLERSIAFVSRVGDRTGLYRYHRMFGELLRSQLRHRMPDLLKLQHRSAARWYAKNGDLPLAARHALTAGDCALAGNLVATSWPELLVHGDSPVAGALITSLPRAVVTDDPELSLAAASIHLESGELSAGRDYLRIADDTAAAVKPKRRAEFTLTRAIADLYEARAVGDFERVRASAEALAGGHGSAVAALDGRERRALGLVHTGIAETWTGRHQHARTALEDALGLARHADREYLTFCTLAALSLLEAVSGAFVTAAALAQDAGGLAARHGWSARGPTASARCALSICAYHWNDLGDARRSLATAEAALGAAGDPALRVLVSLTRGRVELRSGDAEPAAAALDAAGRAASEFSLSPWLAVQLAGAQAQALAAAGQPGDVQDVIRIRPPSGRWAETELVWARVALAAGDPGGAADTARAALDGAVAMADPSTAIEIRALGAVAEHRRGDDDRALQLVEEALALAEPQQDLAPFLSVGPAVRELLVRRIRAGTAHRSLAGELGELLDPLMACPVNRGGAMGLEPLSEREEVVLRYLPATLSKAEIASEMSVSVNTVKTHMKNIYRKLDVTDRAQAVRRARTLHLV
jgi:LuxR family transcriptional regulator, maltose regulon positive regulatory protein